MSRNRLPLTFEPFFTATSENKEYMRMENEFAERLAQEEIDNIKEKEISTNGGNDNAEI